MIIYTHICLCRIQTWNTGRTFQVYAHAILILKQQGRLQKNKW